MAGRNDIGRVLAGVVLICICAVNPIIIHDRRDAWLVLTIPVGIVAVLMIRRRVGTS